MINAVTRDTVWADDNLQYYFGGSTALSLDSEFKEGFREEYTGNPDSVFAYGKLVSRAFAAIDSVIATDFSKTSSTTAADVVFLSSSNNNDPTLEGFCYFPGTIARSSGFWTLGVFTSGNESLGATPERGGGAYGQWTFMHEIGHGMGLLHPFNDDTGVALGAVGTALDNERYTVMSYSGATEADTYGHAVSLMAIDIATLQSLYGAERYAEANSSYTLGDTKGMSLDLTQNDVEIGRAYYCVWDSGGTDRIDYAGAGKSVLINLNDATLDREGVENSLATLLRTLASTSFFDKLATAVQDAITDSDHHAGGFFSQVLTKAGDVFKAIDGGFSIAHDAVIENATGGSAGDLLVGNESRNILKGLSGNDTLLGGSGNDTLVGGKGGDQLFGGAGKDRFDFNSSAEIGLDDSAHDFVSDFRSGDVLDLSTLDANGSATGSGKFRLIEETDFDGDRACLIWYNEDFSGSSKDRTWVEGDINGDYRADFQLEMKGLLFLTEASFIL